MISKYIIDNNTVFLDEIMASFYMDNYADIMEFGENNILVSWFYKCFSDCNLASQLYFEVKRELINEFDYKILKLETIKVIDTIASEFEINKNSIQIFFNGRDGFYIDIPGCLIKNNAIKSAKVIAEYIKEISGVTDMQLDIYELDSYHIVDCELNHDTKLYLNNVSYDMLESFKYKDIISFCSYQRYEYFADTLEITEEGSEKINSLISDVLDKVDNDYSKWAEGYNDYNMKSKQFYIDSICHGFYDNQCTYKFLYDISEELNKVINSYNNEIISNNQYIYEQIYDSLVKCTLHFISDSKTINYYIREDDMCSLPYTVLYRGNNRKNIVLVLNSFFVGNDEMVIYLRSHFNTYDGKEFAHIIGIIYEYLSLYKNKEMKIIK